MTKFEISSERSTVWIEATSSMHPIHSESHGLTGFFEADVLGGGRVNPQSPVHGHLELPVEELSSGNALYDRELKRRVDARRYPVIVGDLDTMEEDGAAPPRADGARYRVGGKVSFRGETRHVEDEMTLELLDDGALCLRGEHVFDIREFGMDPPKIMMLKVYPDVTVRVEIVAEPIG